MGAQAQTLDPFLPIEETQRFTVYQMFLVFILGLITGIFLMRYLQHGSSSILSPRRRLSGFLQYIWRFTYYVCRSLFVCTCNFTCWFRRQNSLDGIYGRLHDKGKSKGKGKSNQRQSLTTTLASARDLQELPGHMMLSLRAGHPQILGPQASSMAALLRAHQVVRLYLLVGQAFFQSCNISKYTLHISPSMQGGLFETCPYLPQQ